MIQRQYMLDTNVLLHIVRGKEIGAGIEAKFKLKAQSFRPVICVVTHGEIWAIAERNQWNPGKRKALDAALAELPQVDISSGDVLRAYVEVQLHTQRQGRPMGQNDLWIAAAAKATDSYLLACDRDFEHLYGVKIRGEYIDPDGFRS